MKATKKQKAPAPGATYVPAPGSKFTAEQAAVIGAEIERVAKGNVDGKATPRAVLEAARSPESPLHRFFEWDNDRAAERHRLEQAKHMLRSIDVVFVKADQPVQTRAFHVIQNDTGDRGYVPAEVVFSNVDMTAEIVGRAKAEAASWHRRYQRIRSAAGLAPVFAAIEAAGIVPAEEPAKAAE